MYVDEKEINDIEKIFRLIKTKKSIESMEMMIEEGEVISNITSD